MERWGRLWILFKGDFLLTKIMYSCVTSIVKKLILKNEHYQRIFWNTFSSWWIFPLKDLEISIDIFLYCLFKKRREINQNTLAPIFKKMLTITLSTKTNWMQKTDGNKWSVTVTRLLNLLVSCNLWLFVIDDLSLMLFLFLCLFLVIKHLVCIIKGNWENIII